MSLMNLQSEVCMLRNTQIYFKSGFDKMFSDILNQDFLLIFKSIYFTCIHTFMHINIISYGLVKYMDLMFIQIKCKYFLKNTE